MLHQSRKMLNVVGKLEMGLGVAILVAIVTIILSQVFSRYLLGRPLIWAEEMATYLLIWLGFVAASVAYKLQRHIAIQTYDSFTKGMIRRIATALIHALIIVVLAIVIAHIPDAMRTEQMQSTVGLPINIGLHWFFTVPTLVACISMAVTALFYVFDALVGPLTPILVAQSDPSLDDEIIKDSAPESYRR